jgi:hypothetical protein
MRRKSLADFNTKAACRTMRGVSVLKPFISDSFKLNSLFLFTLIISVIALWGCSTTKYIMPDTASGRECVRQAERERSDCYRIAGAKWEDCMEKERNRAQKRYDEAMDRYHDEVDRCERDYREAKREWERAETKYKRCKQRYPEDYKSKCSYDAPYPGINKCHYIREPILEEFIDQKWCDDRQDDDLWVCKNAYDRKFVNDCRGRKVKESIFD